MKTLQFGFVPMLMVALFVGTHVHPPTEASTKQSPQPSVSVLSTQTSVMVGQKVCQPCHVDAHETWNGSRHSKMVQPATPASVRGDFGKSSISLRDLGYRLRRDGDRFFITEKFFTGIDREHEVEYTLGNRRIQHYLTTLDDGRVIVLPPSWDVLRNEWFHNLDIAAPDQQQGEVPVQIWNKNCFGCHVSDEKKRYDPVERSYETEWLDFGGNCERCHGPGSRHVDRYTQSDLYGDDPNNYIVLQTSLDHERNSQVCAQCHSFRDELVFGFSAGSNYYDHFLPFLEYTQGPSNDPTWYPDGKTRRFSTNALGLWQSECFLKGGVACTNCHVEAHEPEIERNDQLKATNNALCTTCHESLVTAAQLEAHSFHQEESAGSSCVNCHMPKSVMSIKATMRDHSISIPSPENTAKYEVPNACNVCHESKSTQWAVDSLDTWYPNSRRRKKIERRADAFQKARNGEEDALGLLVAMILDDNEGFINRANAIGYLSNYSDPRILPVLEKAVEDKHPLVRAGAALRLSQVSSITAEMAQPLLVKALEDERTTVRMNAAVSLLNLGISRLDGPAGDTFEESKRLHVIRGHFFADDAPQQMNLGRFHVLNRDPEGASRAFDNSYDLDPNQPGIKYLMAVTHLSRSKPDAARALLREIADGDPFSNEAKALLKKLTGHPE